ncbi:MAG: M14 family zinc carboxypeptidase [Bacteroidota bacterium]
MSTFFQSTIQSLARELFDSYDFYKASGISSSRFTQAEMLQWLHPFKDQHLFGKSVLGASVEGREIALYSIGDGSTKVMLWSQMHGDEPTATMALMDIFSFFAKNPEHIATKNIREKLTLLVIPMLNPDGAERFTRRTAQMIDMNRDALALATPEAKILKNTRDRYQPEYGFNLHDQEPRYTVGTTQKITAIALLAPAADESRGDNPVRLRAKRVASTLAQVLNLFIPENLAKWDDTFCPTAFGDNIQKWGTSTVLIDSGGWRGDPDKFFIRKLNCIGLLVTLYAIAVGESRKADIAVYEQIPFNMKLGCDYIIRNAVLKSNGQIAPIRVDVGINFNKRISTVTGQIDEFATIVEIGDLNAFTALEKEVNANGAELDADLIKMEYPLSMDKVALLLK